MCSVYCPGNSMELEKVTIIIIIVTVIVVVALNTNTIAIDGDDEEDNAVNNNCPNNACEKMTEIA